LHRIVVSNSPLFGGYDVMTGMIFTTPIPHFNGFFFFLLLYLSNGLLQGVPGQGSASHLLCLIRLDFPDWTGTFHGWLGFQLQKGWNTGLSLAAVYDHRRPLHAMPSRRAWFFWFFFPFYLFNTISGLATACSRIPQEDD
jgi:hypothetical protein